MRDRGLFWIIATIWLLDLIIILPFASGVVRSHILIAVAIRRENCKAWNIRKKNIVLLHAKSRVWKKLLRNILHTLCVFVSEMSEVSGCINIAFSAEGAFCSSIGKHCLNRLEVCIT